MGIICTSFGIAHRHVQQFVPCLLKSWGGGVILDAVVLQVVEPFLYRRGGNIVELIDADDIVFWEHVLRYGHSDFISLLCVNLQPVTRMYPLEYGLSVIEIVASLAEVEIEDVDGIDLFHLVVFVAYLNMLGNRLGNTVEHALQVVQLSCELNLNDDDFFLAVLCLDVYTVELGISCLLVALALQQFRDDNLLAQQYGDEPFQYCKVSLVAQHALHCPVKSHISVFCLHVILFLSHCKNRKYKRYIQDFSHFSWKLFA